MDFIRCTYVHIVFIVAMLDNTLMNKLKSELDNETTIKEEVNYVCICIN